MDLANQRRNRSPTEVASYFTSYVKVDAGDEEIPANLHQLSEIPQAGFGLGGMHVAKEPVRNDNILLAQGSDQTRVSRVAYAPADTVAEAWPDSYVLSFPLE
jgi:hypothetical protein